MTETKNEAGTVTCNGCRKRPVTTTSNGPSGTVETCDECHPSAAPSPASSTEPSVLRTQRDWDAQIAARLNHWRGLPLNEIAGLVLEREDRDAATIAQLREQLEAAKRERDEVRNR